MEIKKKWFEASYNRVSRRTFLEKKINESDINALLELIKEINEESKLNIQLVTNSKDGISGFKASYGMISGANTFIALVGSKNSDNYKQKLGYYGEMLVLEAVSRGIETCWIGGTYNKKSCENKIKISGSEELACIIAIGYAESNLSIKEKLVKQLNKKEKSIDDILVSKHDDIPSWVLSGIECALKAPSAINKKPVIYQFENDKIEAIILNPNHGYEELDLGISMLHFQIGALNDGKSGNWSYDLGHFLFY